MGRLQTMGRGMAFATIRPPTNTWNESALLPCARWMAREDVELSTPRVCSALGILEQSNGG